MTDLTRLIDPPRSAFDRLPNRLTDGERQVIDLFDRDLDPAWEMYVQPHLNGLRPDLVLLNPDVGIAVFEIKDWDLSAMRYFVSGSDLRAERDGKSFPVENPINKILLYKNEIFKLYCPRLDTKAGQAAITAGLMFTRTPRGRVVELLGPIHEESRKYPKYYPIAGSDDLHDDLGQSSLDRIFPEWKRTWFVHMNPCKAKDLRGWLREPAFSKEQRHRPIPLSQPQHRLVTTRTSSGYRRIRGPAGSGKSVVVACRAAELAQQGGRVLVVCFNITLLNYLRDLAVRHVTAASEIQRSVDFLNFHRWCKLVCEIGDPEAYSRIWRNSDDCDPQRALRALDSVVELVEKLYREKRIDPVYDAILVDEGQDFRLRWWNVLRNALKQGGEMVLVADKTQDIYGNASSWTDVAMEGCGFTGGRWSELKESYRLPALVIPFVQKFADKFLTGEVDLPIPVQMELDIDECRLRWVHVENKGLAAQACFDELIRMMKALPKNTAVADLTFICSGRDIGRDVVEKLQEKHVHVRHTFAENSRTVQEQKWQLFQGDARVKATTIHSYKGWEGKLLVVFVDSIDGVGGELLYTAMTRLRRGGGSSCLTIVSTCADLQDFAGTWPEYEEY